MIPKIIHYCWFGPSPLPPLAERCIASWRRYMPEYELRIWTEETFDVESIPFTRDAYRYGKYAFVSDYARIWALHKFGGVYLDTDVELLRSLDPICAEGAWMGREQGPPETPDVCPVAIGLGFAMPAGHPMLARLVEQYASLTFPDPQDKASVITVVKVVTDVLTQHGLTLSNELQQIGDIRIYPWQYFSPRNYFTGRTTITDETYSIHHYDASWMSPSQKLKDRLVALLGPLGHALIALKRRLRS